MSRAVVWLALLVLCSYSASTETSQLEAKYPLISFTGEKPIRTVLEGSDVILPCRTTCDCPQKNDVKTSWRQDGHRVSVVGGNVLSSGSLRLRNVTATVLSGKIFRCVANIGNWSVIGIERRINVIKTKSLSLRPAKQILSRGDTASLQCTSSIPDEPLQELSWYKDGISLPTGNTTKYQKHIGGYLLIRGLLSSDKGLYSCRSYSAILQKYLVSNGVNIDIASNNALISIPHFTHRLSNQEVKLGRPLAYICIASASPQPAITISFLKYLSSEAKQVASGVGYANFTLPRVQNENEGWYICKASSKDVTISHEVQLKVLSPPTFDNLPEKRKLTIDTVTLSLSCYAAGNPFPEITWYKNGVLLQGSEDGNIKIDVTGKLTIESTRAKDVGIYQCFASNKVGTIQHSTFVFLEASVRPPTNVRAQALSSSEISVTWQSNPLNNENAILAHIIVFEDTLSKKRKETVLENTSVSGFKIDRLFGGTDYSVYLTTYGRNSVRSEKSQIVKITTLESKPGIAPRPIKAVNFGNRTIRVTWNLIPRKNANGIIIRYKIEYGIVGFKNKHILVPAGHTHVDIHNLNIGELYMIEVSAATKIGFGPAEKTTIKIGNPEIAGQKGPPLELHSGQPSELLVRWSLDKANLITGFELSYIPVPTAYYWHDIRKVQLQPDSRSYTVKPIDRSKMYRIELRIQSGPVVSKPSTAVFIPTKRSAIPSDLQLLKVSSPRELHCAVKDNTSIFMSWIRPVLFADVYDYSIHIIHGGKTIEKLKVPHTRDLKYFLRNVTRGTWYYARVKANPKSNRVMEVRKQLKRAFVVPDYYSKVVACKTVEARPGPPSKALCNVSANAHYAKITWYPPDHPRGLITKYIVKYRERSLRLTRDWTTHEKKLVPSSNGFPYSYTLIGDYYKQYEIRIVAVNSAGEGLPAVIDKCSLRRKHRGHSKNFSSGDSNDPSQLMSDDTKLGIIIGCTVASLFILTFVIVFIWKNPFRVKSNGSERSQTNAIPSGVSPEDYLYLQRLAELQNSLSRDINECSTRCSSETGSKLANGRNTLEKDKQKQPSAEPLMSKYTTSVELTGSSSGPAVCTCTCLLHGRLRGQSAFKPQKPDFLSAATSTRDDVNDTHSNASSSTSEDIDSAESADSRTQMLPKSDTPNCVYKDPVTYTQVTVQKKKETTFQV